jgi:hypothetical protein
MFSIEKCPVPADALLYKYTKNGSYTDCYSTEVPEQISFPEYVFAFYTTPLIKLERLILRLTVSKPSTDIEARRLADGVSDRFAAWDVEGRGENEILMCDFQGRTRSWLMVASVSTVRGVRTRLYFGSAVIPVRSSKTGKSSLGFGVQALLGFHKIYSILLLYSVKSRLKNRVFNKES